MSDITAALFSLKQQSVARGLAGRLGDFDIRLCEDNRTVSIWAFFELNPPLMASIELPEPIDPATFDAVAYYGEAAKLAAGHSVYLSACTKH